MDMAEKLDSTLLVKLPHRRKEMLVRYNVPISQKVRETVYNMYLETVVAHLDELDEKERESIIIDAEKKITEAERCKILLEKLKR